MTATTPARTRPIQSAETVAVLRAATACERDPTLRGSDAYARHFIGPRYRLLLRLAPSWLLRRIIDGRVPGSYYFSLVRTREFDEALVREARAGARQVVLLGAGYDTRALRFAHEIGAGRVFEVDFPATQARKLECLRRAGLTFPPGVAFIPVDFNVPADGEHGFERALVAAGFDPGVPTLFLWEGVAYYLPEASVRRVLGFVQSCASGSAIVFDYPLRSFVEGDHGTYGGQQIARWLVEIGEPFAFGLNTGEVERFIASCGLELVRDVGAEDLERKHLTRDGKSIGRMLGHTRIAHARRP